MSISKPSEPFEVLQRLFEEIVVDAEHHVGIHLNEAAIGVVGESAVLERRASPSTVSSLRPRLSTVSIMPGIEAREPERTDTSSGLSTSPNLAPRDLADSVERGLTIGFNDFGKLLAELVIDAADLGGDGEARRDGQPKPRHLGEIGALAAEQIALRGIALGAAGAEGEDPMGQDIAGPFGLVQWLIARVP